MWVHKMCSVNKSPYIYVALYHYHKLQLSMKLQRKTKAAVIFCKLFDSRAFTCICLFTRIDHVHPLKINISVICSDFIRNGVKIQIF